MVVTTIGIIGPTVAAATRITPASEEKPVSVSSSLNSAQIAGIVIGAVTSCGLVLVTVIATFVTIRRRKGRQIGENPESPNSKASDKELATSNPLDEGEMDGHGIARVELDNACLPEMDDGSQGPVEAQGSWMDHELAGGYEARGVSELEGSPPSQRRSGERA